MPVHARSHRSHHQNSNHRILFLCILFLLLCPPVQGLGTILGFFQQMQDLGILRFNGRYFLTDLWNLFFGKRRFQCATRIQRLLANSGPLLQGGYRDSSVMILPEAGTYVGEDSILEYVKFADARFSPYVQVGPEKLGESQKVIGFHEETGTCEYHWFRLNRYSMNADYVEQENVHFALPVLTKVYLDYAEEYLTAAHVFYSKPFLNFYFGEQLNTQSVAKYICENALAEPLCVAQLGDPPEDCVAQFSTIPLTDADLYVDGDSRSCRALHATFVAANPSHCQHVSLDPNDVDGKGQLKCSSSSQLPHSNYFDDGDMERFEEFQVVCRVAIQMRGCAILYAHVMRYSRAFSIAQAHGIDPSQGYRRLSSIDEPLL